MTLSAILTLLSALVGVSGPHAPDARDALGEGGPAVVEQRVLIAQSDFLLRIPLRPRLREAFEWEERKGPKCISSDDIRGAVLSGPAHVDFVLAGHPRVRAELSEDCPALDFYSGFYVSPDDERICAKRDSISSRVGGSCRIERFRELVRKR